MYDFEKSNDFCKVETSNSDPVNVIKMGELAALNYQLINRIYPIRKYVLFASVAFIVLSFLIILESAFILTSNHTINSPFLIIFSYLLAWLLILFGVVGLKYGCLSASIVNTAPTIQTERPTSPAIWITGTLAQPQEEGLNIPGMVPNLLPGYPAPPPRYSSLGINEPPVRSKSFRIPHSAHGLRSPPPSYPRHSIV
ncbi:unnamed protein product [Bursaphelenchus xylophilus]|uniref:(pine wood nematode) hypothetical protein n=1 Tax=Bursaphelenchus xylophilus TaxID=6326 RepID=A0A1I7SS23_BURXY|nr:unnamed protein product [Bursaphelenchus xylophilus]CAG9105772.1 unnamed protein product [Bursaphelenchus xylophilus]